MHISEMVAKNFRLLKDSKLDFRDKLCLLLGRNNSGKTSFLVLFEKFYNNYSFDFNDFSISQREKIEEISTITNAKEIAIQLIIKIEYEESDDLCDLSEFIMDLDPKRRNVNILFECSISKDQLLESIIQNPQISKNKFIRKYLSQYLAKEVYIFENDDDLELKNRYRLIAKDLKDVRKLIDFEIIHAKRSVSSSEEKASHKVLSGLTTKYYNNTTDATPNKFEIVNALIEKMDSDLGEAYDKFFDGFIRNAREFLSLDGLKIISNLKANEIISDSSEVIYGDEKSYLPEYLNGLGYMNILYLLLSIEIRKSNFATNNKDIKLLFIEEPEAHTHPQLQCIFARKVEDILRGISGLQTIITTHSPHIVANHPFKNIRYMLLCKDSTGSENIEIKNFHKDLSDAYKDEMKEFQFVKQYLSIEAAELFFASKVIFIEGVSENILMPLFISKFDKLNLKIEQESIKLNPQKKAEYIPVSSQNISILQVGANAKAFKHFMELLRVKTLVITDLDTVKKSTTRDGKTIYPACKVEGSPISTSNETLKYYYSAPVFGDEKYDAWLKSLISHDVACISDIVKVEYQKKEKDYCARSFEDAFLNVNYEDIKKHKDEILGLKNINYFDRYSDIYNLTKSIIDKKSDFAASLLFLAHTQDIDWNIPLYIWEGLEWIQKN